MGYTKAVLEEKLHDTRDQLKEQEKENEQLKANCSARAEENQRLEKENARYAALIDQLNTVIEGLQADLKEEKDNNEGLRALVESLQAQLRMFEVGMCASELDAYSAALADETDALVKSLPATSTEPVVSEAETEGFRALTARIRKLRDEQEAKEIVEKSASELEAKPKSAPESEPEPRRAEVEELPVDTDIGAEVIKEITPKRETLFDPDSDEVKQVDEEEEYESTFEQFDSGKKTRYPKENESEQRGFFMRIIDRWSEGECPDED